MAFATMVSGIGGWPTRPSFSITIESSTYKRFEQSISAFAGFADRDRFQFWLAQAAMTSMM